MERLCNFFYFEIIDLLISLFAWKGAWDLVDMGSLFLFDESKLKSFIFTGILGYGLYILLILFQKIYSNFQTNKRYVKRKHVEDCIYIFSYISMVAVWRTFWNGYDYYVFNLDNYTYLIFLSHFGIFILLFMLKLGSSLYGPGGLSSNADLNKNSLPIDAKILNDNFFEIKYF